eukprot:c2525_g1_i1.p1 GENE.c2525_g1_i1~~c2525_g1_i1.p1  ORF type:complete len:361 (-),score=95.97 c2525_g1_i1:316-1398(-)
MGTSKMSTAQPIPTKMRALKLVKHVKDFKQEDLASCFEVQEVDVPVPKSGEVLVKVECSPINPSNLSALQGTYDNSSSVTLPARTGSEGSGTVVASGGGVFAWMVSGKRVGTIARDSGMWAEYVVVPATVCIPLPDDVSFEGGASCFVNPLTVIAFIEIAQARKVKAIVHTAAASALGKMLVRFGRENDIAVICVVRRQEQEDSLKEVGAQHIVNSSQEDWKSKLSTLCKDLNATIAFEAIAGPTTGDVLSVMPNNSELFVYGGLSHQSCCNISPLDLIFKGKKVSGFWLPPYLKSRGAFGVKSMMNKVASGIKTTFATTVRTAYSLEDVAAAIQDYTSQMSNDKIVFKPSLVKDAAPSA